MSKIVKAYAVTVESSIAALPLLKEFNLFGKKEAPKEQPKPEEDSPEVLQTTSSALSEIASRVMAPSGAVTRFVLNLSHGQLKDFYLKAGGGGDTAQLFDSEEELKNLTLDPTSGKSRLVQMKSGFKLGDMVTSNKGDAGKTADRSVLLNIPNALATKLKDPNLSTEALQELLKEFFAHKYYVATLITDKAAQIAPAVDAAQNGTELEKAFNPRVLDHYRDMAALKQAYEDFDRLNDPNAEPDAEVEQLGRVANREEEKRKAQKKLMGDEGSEEEQLLMKIVRADGIDEVTNTIAGMSNAGYSNEQLVTMLKSINKKLQSKVIDEVLGKLQLNSKASSQEPKKSEEEKDRDRIMGTTSESTKILGNWIK